MYLSDKERFVTLNKKQTDSKNVRYNFFALLSHFSPVIVILFRLLRGQIEYCLKTANLIGMKKRVTGITTKKKRKKKRNHLKSNWSAHTYFISISFNVMLCLALALFNWHIHFPRVHVWIKFNKIDSNTIDIFHVIKCSRLKTWNVRNFTILIDFYCARSQYSLVSFFFYACLAIRITLFLLSYFSRCHSISHG